MSEPLAILRVGMCCSVGLDAAQTASSIRAGVTRKSESWILDWDSEPVILGHLADRHLPPLVPSLAKRARTSAIEPRLLRLAGAPLAEVLSAEFAKLALPVHLALPEPLDAQPFVSMLGEQAQRRIDVGASRVFTAGHAGFFSALAAARDELITPGRAEFVVVGGVDTYVDAERVAALERAGRLRTSGPQDAFTPGEAAAFVVVANEATRRRHNLSALAWITSVGVSGGGELATLCSAVLDGALAPDHPIRLVMAGLNGESKSAKQWGVARIRNQEHFARPLRVEHPAEYTGDSGAALAPMMLGTAALWIRAGTVGGPALVWASADSGDHGALVLYAPA
ncbi:3-oxoacyl-(acyl carrier protein) synthase [Enhygromyxa salina]|uniref:3-oxoacyl-(Acyl carrier protein) synthase n=1 Tax=Enhygromyxa salina TaxID=215803 RepID=A0A2S9YEV2_9BACT|nr:beta-ketoacyl synthase N-terminal-like domain-containing protein [Enhygromyxa salina]PRQ03623.1 3-oxoacyl-(acyl carrier protein) synthase [Enhygromyxa salina]